MGTLGIIFGLLGKFWGANFRSISGFNCLKLVLVSVLLVVVTWEAKHSSCLGYRERGKGIVCGWFISV